MPLWKSGSSLAQPDPKASAKRYEVGSNSVSLNYMVMEYLLRFKCPKHSTFSQDLKRYMIK